MRIPQPQKLSPHSVQGSKFSISDKNNSKWGTPSPPQLNVSFHLIAFHFPQLTRMCCIKLCAGRLIRVPDDVAQLDSHVWLHDMRHFKTQSRQIVCLLGGPFSTKPSLKSTAPAVVQSPGFLSIPWPVCKEQLVTRLTNHQLTLSGMWSHGKGERPRYHARNIWGNYEKGVDTVHLTISACSLTGFAFLPVSQLRAHFTEQLQNLGSFQLTGNSKFFCLFILGWFRTKKLFFFLKKFSGNYNAVF